MPQTKSKQPKTSQDKSDLLLNSNIQNSQNPIFALPSHSATPAFQETSDLDESNDSTSNTPSSSSYLQRLPLDGLPNQDGERQVETVLVGRPSPSPSPAVGTITSNLPPHPSLPLHPQVPSIWQSNSTSANRIDQNSSSLKCLPPLPPVAAPAAPPPQQFEYQQPHQSVHSYLPHPIPIPIPIPIHQQSLPVQLQQNLSQTRIPQLPPEHQHSLPLPPQQSHHPSHQSSQPPARPFLASSNSGHLPPTYDAHDFPSDPPGPPESSESGGRFPRWRGWLEKRALERHYNRLDSSAVSREFGLSSPLGSNEELEIVYTPEGKPVLNEQLAKKLAKKKSWGKHRDDGDAISDEEEKLERESRERGNIDDDRPPSPLPLLPPLHSHSFGSRFLPHLPSQPLAAVYLDLPHPLVPPKSPRAQGAVLNVGGFKRNGISLQTQNGNRGQRRKKEDQVPPRKKLKLPPPRRVLLIGTAEGIFACEMRREKQTEPGEELQDFGVPGGSNQFGKGKAKEPEAGKWNGGIRVVQIWSGLGIYQLSVLSSSSSNDPQTSPPSGILLALTAPTPKPNSTFRVPLNRLSGMASALEHLASSSSSSHGHQSSSSSGSHARESSHGHHSHSNPKDFAASSTNLPPGPELPSAKFGGAGGGGIGCAIPSNSGIVKMWSLDALRKLATLALDGDLTEPLDLANSSDSSKRSSLDHLNAKSKISSKLRRAWATLGDSSSDRAARGGDSPTGTVEPLLTQSVSRGSLPRQYSSAVGDDLIDGSVRPSHARSLSSPDLEMINDDLRRFQDGFPVPSVATSAMDQVRSRAMNLALSSVAINSSTSGGSSSASIPLAGTEGGIGASPSFSSLFNEDSLGGGNSSQSAAEKSKHRASKDSNGVLFYAVHEASSEEKGRGTWYLALSTSKTIMLYEAQPPKNQGAGSTSSNRSFRFLRELYTPFSPNAIAFVTANNVSEERNPIAGVTSNAKLSVGSPSGPLLTKPYGKNASNPLQYSGPPSWKGPDLSLFVSFGKRAVMIRVSDSNVREIELMPASQAISTDPSLAPLNSISFHKPNSSAETLSKTLQAQASPKRPKSLENSWVGLSVLEARVNLRQKKRVETQEESEEAAWNRNISRSGQAATDAADDALTSDSSYEDYDLEQSVDQFRSLSLDPASASTSSPFPTPLPARKSLDDGETVHTVSSSLVLLSKGHLTQILPSPLPADLSRPRPLAVFEWSEPPSAVTGLARVVGIERESSSGFTSTSNLRSSSSSGSKASTRNSLTLRISVTAIGFITSSDFSRVEMKRTTVRTTSHLSFKLDSSLELEIDPYPLSASPPLEKSKYSILNERGPNLDKVSLQENQNSMSLAMDYPGGLLLSSPVNGARAHPSLGLRHWRPEEAAGEGGGFAWDYRGGEDYRIFYVGAEV